MTAQRALYGVCDTIIDRRRSGPGGQQDLLGLLLDARDDGQQLTDAQVRDVRAWLSALTGELPAAYIAEPQLPKTGP